MAYNNCSFRKLLSEVEGFCWVVAGKQSTPERPGAIEQLWQDLQRLRLLAEEEEALCYAVCSLGYWVSLSLTGWHNVRQIPQSTLFFLSKSPHSYWCSRSRF